MIIFVVLVLIFATCWALKIIHHDYKNEFRGDIEIRVVESDDPNLIRRQMLDSWNTDRIIKVTGASIQRVMVVDATVFQKGVPVPSNFQMLNISNLSRFDDIEIKKLEKSWKLLVKNAKSSDWVPKITLT